MTTEGKDNTIVFFYILENMTDFDYSVDKDQRSTMTTRLGRQNGLTPFLSSKGIDYPIFLPARKRMRFQVHLEGYTYSAKEKEDATADERKQYRANLEKYVADKLENLDGFDLLDEERHAAADHVSYGGAAKIMEEQAGQLRPAYQRCPCASKVSHGLPISTGKEKTVRLLPFPQFSNKLPAFFG